MKLAFFYDSRETEKMNLPSDVVALDCSDERVAAIAKTRSLTPPCLVRGTKVLSGRALTLWFASQKPTIVRYYLDEATVKECVDKETPEVVIKETAIEKGKRLAAERKELFGSLFE